MGRDLYNNMKVLQLIPPGEKKADVNGSAVEVRGYTGKGNAVLHYDDCSGADGGSTMDVKLQHCDTINGTYTDMGVAFTQLTPANNAAGLEEKSVNLDTAKRYVRAVLDASATLTNGYKLAVVIACSGKRHNPVR